MVQNTKNSTKRAKGAPPKKTKFHAPPTTVAVIRMKNGLYFNPNPKGKSIVDDYSIQQCKLGLNPTGLGKYSYARYAVLEGVEVEKEGLSSSHQYVCHIEDWILFWDRKTSKHKIVHSNSRRGGVITIMSEAKKNDITQVIPCLELLVRLSFTK